MASLSIARPGKVSERQYLGDLAGLFDRQRRRSGLALTPDSFAADLAANDSLRSGLFTLCNAISHMGETDLSPEELLGLVARALSGAGSAEGETGTQIPASMRDAFLSGYDAWRNRDLQTINSAESEIWPLSARKPPASEPALDTFAQGQLAAVASGTSVEAIMHAPGQRTVQEALSRVRREIGDREQSVSGSAHPANSGDNLGNMTLGELNRLLEEIEGRVSRLGPHIQQLSSAAPEPAPRERRSASTSDTVIPFPARPAPSAERQNDDPHASGFDLEDFTRRRPIPVPNLRAEDAFLSRSSEVDERPRGIDALVAAAPAWARATPTARPFSEDSFLSRHAYLSPARRPGSNAPASAFYVETPAQPLPPPPATLPQVPVVAPVSAAPAPVAHAPIHVPLIGLDVEDDPLFSPAERLQSFLLGLPPRKVFLTLAGLTVFAGALAGYMAYRTLHPSRPPQFKDLEPAVRFGAMSPAPPPPVAPAQTIQAPVAPAPATAAPAPVTTALPAPKAAASSAPRPKQHIITAAHNPPVAVWPPAPQQIARDIAPPPAPSQTTHASAPQPAATGPLYVPPPTMIGYVLASPQPSYPAQAHGVSGTVAVEITVSRLGDVTSARAVSGPQELRASAVAAVRGWRFRPYMVDARPTEVSTTLQFYFKGD